MKTINYEWLGRAAGLYDAAGFRQVEAPWRVGLPIIRLTKPPHVDRADYLIAGTGKALVASGEQSLLYQAAKGALPDGDFQVVTPCFRNDDVGPYHGKQFMKLELMRLRQVGFTFAQADVEAMVAAARAVATELLQPLGIDSLLRVVSVPDHDPLAVPGTRQLDLCLAVEGDRLVELGSYGARRAPFATWVYGTGLAEPRFSAAACEALGLLNHQEP